MKITFKFITLFVLLMLLLMPTGSAYAQGPNPGDGRVIFGSNFTLESGDTFDGDLVVFGGNVTIEEKATLNGNLVVIGGTIDSSGQTKGDVVVVIAQHLPMNAVQVLGLPATLVVERGQPRVVLS